MILPIHLLDAAKNKNLIPFVGAGVSMSLKTIDGKNAYPSWREILEHASTEIKNNGKEKEGLAIETFLSVDMYQNAADIARKNLIGSEWGDFLTKFFDINPSQLDIESAGLPKVLWRISNKIITLNFDKVLRLTCPDSSVVEFDYTQGAQLANFIRAQNTRNFIWHFHGKIDNYPSLIFTSDSYSSLYQQNSAFEAALVSFKSICTSSRLLFIGCSLSDAEMLAEIQKVASIFQENTGPHYALVHKDQENEIRIKLGNLPIEIIPFDAYGKPLLDIVESIAPQIPIGLTTIPSAAPLTDCRKIAVLVANSIDKRHVDNGILKEVKKIKCDLHFLPLNIENLNSLSGYDYIFIISSTQRGKIIIEDEWMGSLRIDAHNLIDNIFDPGTCGIFIFLDNLELDALEKCQNTSMPIVMYPEIEKDLQSSIFFKIFKKSNLVLTEKTVLINEGKFVLKPINGNAKEIRKCSPLSDAIDPHVTKRFVGRIDDIKNLSKKILESRASGDFISIKGSGGIGKTVLAKLCAIEFSFRNLFSEGIFFVDCEFIGDFITFEQQMARIWNFEQYENLKNSIKNHRSFSDILIILDNAESVLTLPDSVEIKSLIDFISDFATIVITTRELINTEKEINYEVRQFTSDEAMTLFKQELGSRDLLPDEEKYVRERIIEELLDNNPLAIKLVIRNMPSGKNFRVLYEELTEDVFGKIRDEDIDIFSSQADRNVERKRSIYASINYSYINLPDKEKLAFEILSLFPAGINMESFKKICEQSKNSKKRDSKKDNNPANQFIINDAVIKSLERKSVIEIDNNIVCLQSLVGRFAEHQFNKKSPSEIKRLRNNAFHYHAVFADALTSMLNDNNKSALVANRTYWYYQKNFLKCAKYLDRIDINPDDVCRFIDDLSVLVFNICAYSSLIRVLDEVKFNFEAGSIHERCIRAIYLSQKYFNGDFVETAKQVKKEYPLDQLATLDGSSSIVRRMVGDILNIYAMEGQVMDLLSILPNYVKNYEGYPDILFTLGEFDGEIISKCRTEFFTLEAKFACGLLELDEIDKYIKGLHKQEHLERIQTNYTRTKLAGSPLTEIDKLVVVNPYSSGIKSLILALTENNPDRIQQHYEEAIENLFNIKYFHVEAYYFYAKYLHKTGNNDFYKVRDCGLRLAKSHGYQYLKFLFEQLDKDVIFSYKSYENSLSEDAEKAISLIKNLKRKSLGLPQKIQD